MVLLYSAFFAGEWMVTLLFSILQNQGTDDDDDDEASVPVPEIGPPTRPQSAKRATTSAYGEWETVKKQPEYVDIQLFVNVETQV